MHDRQNGDDGDDGDACMVGRDDACKGSSAGNACMAGYRSDGDTCMVGHVGQVEEVGRHG
jgi:hypothetical protein